MRNPGSPLFPIPDLLWGELDGGLWHATSRRRLSRIIGDGEIRPDVEPANKGSFSRSIGAISLFDFGPAAVDDAEQARNIVGWFGGQQDAATGIWLELDRGSLGKALINAAEARELWRSDRYRSNFIPGVEACHRGPIPVAAVLRVMMIARANQKWFRWIEDLAPWCLQAIDDFEAELPNRR